MNGAVRRCVLAIVATAGLAGLCPSAGAASLQGSCPSYTVNPIEDICWRCMLPLSIGSIGIANIGSQRDTDNPGSPVCVCPGWPPRYGLELGFWEPSILAEVVRTPYCFPSLGGTTMAGKQAPRHGRRSRSPRGEAPEVWYQAHHYIFPLFYLLGVGNDNPCLMQTGWDLTWITELDPTWNEPDLAAIFNADSLLYGNPVAIAACAADCVAATADFGIAALFWCAGCQGSMYPQQGRITHHNGLVDSSLLTTQRLMYKLHKSFVALAFHGEAALCGPVAEPIMNHQMYKTQMLGPVPQTQLVMGKCCQPFGANSATWRAGREYPGKGEDALYLLFRKRNCCFTFY